MRLCLLIISAAISIKFHQLLKQEIDKDNNNKHNKVDRGVEGQIHDRLRQDIVYQIDYPMPNFCHKNIQKSYNVAQAD